MSWQDLVDTNLLGTGKVSKAAICGVDGQVWAKSNGFGVSIEIYKYTFLLFLLEKNLFLAHECLQFFT